MGSTNFTGWLNEVRALVVDAERALGQHKTWLTEAGAIVSDARNLAEAREALSDPRCRYHVAVVDAELPNDEAFELLPDLPASCSVLLLTGSGDTTLIKRVLETRAQMLTRSAPASDFMFAMCRLVTLSVPDMRRLAVYAREMWRLPPQLSRVLYYNLWSYTDREIADAMGISLHTIQQYQDELRKRTGVRTKHGYMRRIMAYAGQRPPLPMTDQTLQRVVLDTREAPSVPSAGPLVPPS